MRLWGMTAVLGGRSAPRQDKARRTVESGALWAPFAEGAVARAYLEMRRFWIDPAMALKTAVSWEASVTS